MNNRNRRKFEDLIIMDFEKMRESYNKGELDNDSYLSGYEDIINNAETYYLKASGCSRADIEGFSKNIKSYYSDIKTGYYNGDLDDEDYYDGFSKGVYDILKALDMEDIYEEIIDSVYNKEEEHDI